MFEAIQKVRDFANIFFELHAPYLSVEEREDIVGSALLIIAQGKHDIQRSTANTYVQRLIEWTYKTHCSERKRRAELERVEQAAAYMVDDKVNLDEFLADRTGSAASLLIGESNLDQLKSAPCRVEFRSGYSVASYIDEPCFVPPFEVIPVTPHQVALRRCLDGSYRLTDQRNLSEAEVYALDQLRSRYAGCVAAMISEYLHEYGWTSVPAEHRRLIAAFNRGEAPTAIQRRLKLKESTYYSHLKAIKRRGWFEEWHAKKQFYVLRYHPALDGNKRLHEHPVASLAVRLSLRDRIEATGLLPTEGDLLQGAPNEKLIRSYLDSLDRDLQRSAFTSEALIAHDERLRAFIERLVRRPILTEDLSFQEVMSKLVALPVERQKAVIFEALRTQKSIGDLFGLGDYFPDICYSRRAEYDLAFLN